ncbi:uncharacterized protein LOC129605526 [Condylostylus longicornis]|uniref:uncharacterized protein LOC129605526 n=1 Tax=Condylostylus longicornis TaxID=2530218 RepID=UPI00244E0228|nr:uncharacterized protein LOC129605526 [Condylostylus longicornis]XP_055371318.1 uncharacterized protein LOC129605526 [Condylostylus longicornis]
MLNTKKISKILVPSYYYLKTSFVSKITRSYQNVNRTKDLINTMYYLKRAVKYQNFGSKLKIFFSSCYANNTYTLLWPLTKCKKDVLNEKRGIHLSTTFFKRRTSKVEESDKLKMKEQNEKISISDAELLDEALVVITRNKKFREDIEDLKKKLEVVNDHTHNISKNKVTSFLHKKLNKIVGQLDKELNDLETKINKKEKVFCEAELKVEEKFEIGFSNKTEKDMIKISEIIKTVKNLQKGYDEVKLKKVENLLRKIDTNQNDLVSVKDVLIIIEAIIANNVKLHKK